MRRSLRRVSRVGPALLLVTALALGARLFSLGWRIAHQDEARVAEWILHFKETGVWWYRPIVHGPFLPHVNSVVFSVFGPSDFTMRLVVAVVGGTLPLAAWLLRDHLRDSTVVALGLFLAANPLLLYYSRFMRNDLLLAAFMFWGYAFLVRYFDTRRLRTLALAVLAVALGFTTKENAILYPVVWLGAGALLLDHRLTEAVEAGRPALGAVPDWLRRVVVGPVRWTRSFGRAVADGDTDRAVARLRAAWPAAVAAGLVLEFLAVIVLFYAPKSQGIDRPGLWKALSSEPTTLPTVVYRATVGSWYELLNTWGGGMQGDSEYVQQFLDLADVLGAGALVLCLFAVVGFVYDRYTGERPNDVVAGTFYWGAASVVGYPIAVDHPFPWEPIHYVVPLAVPAAAGVGLVYRLGREGALDRDRVAAAAAATILLLSAAQVGYVAAQTSYLQPQSPDNELVQFAQPSGEMHDELATIERVAAEHDGGPDVVFYGELFNRSANATWEPHGTAPKGWFDRLPLPWYLSQYDAEVASTTDLDRLEETRPPVIIALEKGAYGNPNKVADDVRFALSGYETHVHQQYLYDRPLVFFVREDYAS